MEKDQGSVHRHVFCTESHGVESYNLIYKRRTHELVTIGCSMFIWLRHR